MSAEGRKVKEPVNPWAAVGTVLLAFGAVLAVIAAIVGHSAIHDLAPVAAPLLAAGAVCLIAAARA